MDEEREVASEVDVLAWVEQIDLMAGDDESAHYEQDALFRAVLRNVATGSADPVSRKMAAATLMVDEIEFRRWYA